MKTSICNLLAATLLTLLFAGCGPPPISKSQALQDYKAQVELLDRLEAKRKDAERQHADFFASQEADLQKLPPDRREKLRSEMAGKVEKIRAQNAADIAELDEQLKAQKARVAEAEKVLEKLDSKTK